MARCRLARADELEAVLELTHAAFAPTIALGLPSTALREDLAFVRAEAKRGGVFVREAGDGALLGCGRFALLEEAAARRDDLARATAGMATGGRGGALAFARLAVREEARGRLHGHAMVAWLEELARRLGCTEIRCAARSERPDNRGFYLRLGYRITGVFDRHGVPGLRTELAKSLAVPTDTGARP
ncbi:MAG: GNAT family N-acetyltransferase [Myxococcota bacterium]